MYSNIVLYACYRPGLKYTHTRIYTHYCIHFLVKNVCLSERITFFFLCLFSEQKRKEREDSHGRSKKRKKKKKKKHKKRSRDNSESSGSESDTIYPSDLLKKDNSDRCVHRKILSKILS